MAGVNLQGVGWIIDAFEVCASPRHPEYGSHFHPREQNQKSWKPPERPYTAAAPGVKLSSFLNFVVPSLKFYQGLHKLTRVTSVFVVFMACFPSQILQFTVP